MPHALISPNMENQSAAARRPQAAQSPANMNRLAKILPIENVVIDLSVTSKKRVFEQAGLMFENQNGIARSTVTDNLFARNAEAERDALAAELTTLEPSVDKLKGQIADMRQRRNDLNARSNILQAKQEIAQAKDVAASALGGIGGKNLSEDFQKLEDKVALQNARSDARLNSADTSSGKALDDKLAALNKGPSVEDRLAALKKQLDTPAQ